MWAQETGKLQRQKKGPRESQVHALRERAGKRYRREREVGGREREGTCFGEKGR